MPLVEISPDVSLFYEIHTHDGKPDYNKPSLLMLVPPWLNVTFSKIYVEAFRDDYSVTTLATRSHGRSVNPVDLNQEKGSYDFWVGAADVAFVMAALRLPPSHILGPGCSQFQSEFLPNPTFLARSHVFFLAASLKLALLWPQQVLSLSLVGASTLFAAPTNVDAFEEIDAGWVRPDNLEHWVEILGGIGDFVLGDKVYPGWEEVWDRVIPTMARRYNPWKARDIWLTSEANHRVRRLNLLPLLSLPSLRESDLLLLLQHPAVTPELLASIKQPVLFIQGDNDWCFHVNEVQDESRHFKGSSELRFHVIEGNYLSLVHSVRASLTFSYSSSGGPQLVSVTHAPAVIAFMSSFLSRRVSSGYPTKPLPLDAPAALLRAAAIRPELDVKSRDPSIPDSFSLVTPEEHVLGVARLKDMATQETECKLDLPMCFEKEDWDEGAAEQRRFTCVVFPSLPFRMSLILLPLQLVDTARIPPTTREPLKTALEHLVGGRHQRPGRGARDERVEASSRGRVTDGQRGGGCSSSGTA